MPITPARLNPRRVERRFTFTPKTLEVLQKVARVQSKFGIAPAEVGHIPVKAIAAKDVFGNVQVIIGELREVKSQLAIEEEIQPAPLVGGKTPSLIYKNLGDASFLLDGLVGRPLTPQRRVWQCVAYSRRNGIDRCQARG